MIETFKGSDARLDPPSDIDDGPHLECCKFLETGYFEDCQYPCTVRDGMDMSEAVREAYYENQALEDHRNARE